MLVNQYAIYSQKLIYILPHRSLTDMKYTRQSSNTVALQFRPIELLTWYFFVFFNCFLAPNTLAKPIMYFVGIYILFSFRFQSCSLESWQAWSCMAWHQSGLKTASHVTSIHEKVAENIVLYVFVYLMGLYSIFNEYKALWQLKDACSAHWEEEKCNLFVVLVWTWALC